MRYKFSTPVAYEYISRDDEVKVATITELLVPDDTTEATEMSAICGDDSVCTLTSLPDDALGGVIIKLICDANVSRVF